MKTMALGKIKPFAALVLLIAAANFASAQQVITHYVSLSGSNIPPYTNWATAATDIQSAITAAETDSVVLVSNGTYSAANNTISINNDITLQSVNGAEVTIIDAFGQGLCVTMASAKIVGFTVRDGRPLPTPPPPDGSGPSGAGIYCTDSTIQNCRIQGNSNFSGTGAGLSCANSIVTNCDVFGNNNTGIYVYDLDMGLYYPSYGGGIACANSTIVDCRITENQADIGAGIYVTGTNTIRNCLISSNAITTAPSYYFWTGVGNGAINGGDGIVCEQNVIEDNVGSGVYLDGGGIVRSCLIASNSNGGIIVSGGGTVENCTIVSNTTSGANGGIDLEQIVGSSNCVLQNNIVYNNSSNQVSTGISNAVIQFNCIQGWTNLVSGNISTDPQFVNPTVGDYHLSATLLALMPGPTWIG